MAREARENRRSLRWRQALPPAFVATLAGLAAAAPWSRPARRTAAAQIGLYSVLLAGAGLHCGWRDRRPLHVPGVPAAIAVMHLSWGAGFLWSLAGESVHLLRSPGRGARWSAVLGGSARCTVALRRHLDLRRLPGRRAVARGHRSVDGTT
jgi:hypothetical protein